MNDDTISRQAVLNLLIRCAVPENGGDLLYQSIKQLPSAERHGRWVDRWFCSNYSGYDYGMNCSVCGKPMHRQLAEKMPPFCPNCGALMVNEDE